ncbi:MAG TPA: hypothetical protein VHD56_01640 [Tepidisphaeraceae bacterium]|nr:hypothetical protein [Tepidisphaeraceae bacterium]
MRWLCVLLSWNTVETRRKVNDPPAIHSNPTRITGQVDVCMATSRPAEADSSFITGIVLEEFGKTTAT